MCVVCCRAYATFLKKIVDARDVSDVRNRRDLHGLIDGTKLPPQSVLHDAKRLTQAELYASRQHVVRSITCTAHVCND